MAFRITNHGLIFVSSLAIKRQKIVDESEIPTGRIYDVISSLESKELTEKQDSRPKESIAIDPTISLQKLLSRQEGKLDLMKKEVDSIETKRAQLRGQRLEEGIFWSLVLFSDSQALERYDEKIREAKNELLIHFDVSDSSLITHISEFYPSLGCTQR